MTVAVVRGVGVGSIAGSVRAFFNRGAASGVEQEGTFRSGGLGDRESRHDRLSGFSPVDKSGDADLTDMSPSPSA
jgi:hypothetical protein